MTCTRMLEQMLDADVTTLAGVGDSDLARHVRECEQCRRVADVLTRETHALAAAVPTVVPRRHRLTGRISRVLSLPRLDTIAALAAAAALIVFAMTRGIRVDPAQPADVAATVAPGPAAGIAAPSVPPAARTASLTPHAFARPISIEPTRLALTPEPIPAPSDARRAAVVVEPGNGARAAVLRTSDPKITVVWLY